MIKGTHILLDDDAEKYLDVIDKLRNSAKSLNYKEIIVPALWETELFIEKAGEDIRKQIYNFQDKAGREICLIPEVTAIVQKMYKESWNRVYKKPVRLFYVAKCYRYEKPQSGRYREFTQFGVELLGGKNPDDREEINNVVKTMLDAVGLVEYNWNDMVKRGLNYYVEDGFEIECPCLGAQKQVLGGGRYDCGIGFAWGVDRLLLALQKL